MPAEWRCAGEFAHPSWRHRDVDDLLAAHGGTRVLRDDGGAASDAPESAGAFSWQYARLRRDDYAAAELEAWGRRLLAAARTEAFAFFRHEDTGRGPRLAAAMLASASAT